MERYREAMKLDKQLINNGETQRKLENGSWNCKRVRLGLWDRRRTPLASSEDYRGGEDITINVTKECMLNLQSCGT